MFPAILFGFMLTWAFMSEDVKGVILGSVMSGLALGCIYLILLAAFIALSIPAIIFFLGYPQLLLPAVIGIFVVWLLFWLAGD